MSRLPQINPKVFENAIKYEKEVLITWMKDHEIAEREKSKTYDFGMSYTGIFGKYRALGEAHYCNGDPLEKVEECFDAMRENIYKFVEYNQKNYEYFGDYAYRDLGEVAAIYYLIDRKVDFYDPRSKDNAKPTDDDDAYNLYLYSLLTLNEASDTEPKKGWRKTWDLHLFHKAVLEKDEKVVLKVLKNQTKRFERENNETEWFDEIDRIAEFAPTFHGVWDYHSMVMIKYARRHGISVNYTTNYFMEELMQKYP